jgi:hypothetical protein
MDISSKFSLVDFLAYFFPGVLGTLGLFCILLSTPLKSQLLQINFDLSFAILFFVLSYVIGVILSGFIEIFLRRKIRMNQKQLIHIPEYQKELQIAFNDLFCKGQKRESKWLDANFYICRSLVMEFMPNAADFVNRQSSIRQLRLNLIPAVALWLIAGILWGANLLSGPDRGSGIFIIIGSIILAILIVYTLVNRMNKNEEREAREVQTAFLAGYHTGLFNKAKKTE